MARLLRSLMTRERKCCKAMIRFLFKILQSLPAFKNLLNEYFAAERKELDKSLADYKLKALDDAATIEKYAAIAQQERQKAEGFTQDYRTALRLIKERDAEIERLKNETQNKLKAVADLSSEDVFNATLYSPKPAPVLRGDPPTAKRQSADELRWNRS